MTGRPLRALRSTGAMIRCDPNILALFVLASTSLAVGSDQAPPGSDAGVAPNQSVDLTGGMNLRSAVPESSAGTALPVDDNGSPDRMGDEQTASVSETIDKVPERAERSATYRRRQETATGPLGTGLGALAVVLGVVAVVYWAVRRWVPSLRGVDGGFMKVAGRISLTPKHHAALVFMGRRLVLVGIAPNGLSTLSEITDPGEVAELMSRAGVKSVKGGAAFEEQLLREVGEFGLNSEETPHEVAGIPTSVSPGRETMGELLRKLRRMRST